MKRTLPGLAMSALVLGAALFAFSPRPLPAFPVTAIHADRLQVNGLARAGARIAAVGERGVILQEIGQANDTPDDIIFDHFQATAYPKQPMGRPTLGTEEVIGAMPRDALTGYMRRHYGPERMVVAAAGVPVWACAAATPKRGAVMHIATPRRKRLMLVLTVTWESMLLMLIRFQ